MATPSRDYDLADLLSTTVWVGLMSHGSELRGDTYERVFVPDWDLEDGQLSNRYEIMFPVPTRPWGEITHFGLFEEPEGGPMMRFGKMYSIHDIYESDRVCFEPGRLKVRALARASSSSPD